MNEEKKNSSRKNLWIGLVLLCITAAAIIIGIWAMNGKKDEGPLVPDYAPVEKEDNAEKIENDDDQKLDKPEGGGSVSLSYSREITISLADQKAALYFANPGKSNEDIVVQLMIQDHVIAQSGTISPGYEIKSLDLDSSAESLLQEGTYEGTLVIHYYDQESGERAVLNTEIPVTITVAA